MTDIALGQTISGTLGSTNLFQQYPRYSDFAPVPFKRYYTQYALPDVPSFDQIKVTLSSDSVPLSGTHLSIYDLATNNILAETDISISGSALAINKPANLYETTYPGIKYGIQISEDVFDGNPVPSGSYSLSLTDQGKTTSLLSVNTFKLFNLKNDLYPNQIVGVTAAGIYNTLATGTTNLDDIAISPSGLFYGIKSSYTTLNADQLWVVDPSLREGSQIGSGANLKDTSGNILFQRLNALAFSDNNQLYAIGRSAADVSGFYQIDVNTKVATLISTLPAGLNTAAPSGNTGDLVYDAANKRFLVASVDTTSSSNALWQIPLANPAGATKIGNIGFSLIVGLSFENGQLTGFIGDNTYGPEGKVIINTSTGIGTLDPTFSTTNYVLFTGATSIVTPKTRNDFNGDGKADILWRNDNGNVAIWQMKGSTLTTGSVFASVSTDWTISNTGDFNGDGKSDILWRNTDGSVALWQMNGATPTTQSVIGSVPTNWKISNTGDFNGDGKSDILWRNTTDGSVAIWQMNGTTPTAQTVVGAASTDWKIVGTGDFNGDGKSDMLWRNDNGSVAMWQMNGTTPISQTVFANFSNDWQIAGTGDFNGDGKADILWRNNDGQVAIWQMNGTNALSKDLTTPYPSVDNSWKIAGTSDFNGDGKSDILWRNDNGSVETWLMNGSTVTAASLVSPNPVVDNTWKIAAPIL
jgi:FG-GAP-like repeat